MQIAWRKDGELRSEFIDLESPGFDRESLARRISEASKWIFHNAKFDLQKLLLAGIISREDISPERIEDTEACAHLLDEHSLKGLKHLAREVLGEETDEEEVLKVERRKLKLRKEDGYHLLPRDVVRPYALKDVEFTLRLWEVLRPKIMASEDLEGLYALEMELSTVLLDMESAGMGVDLGYAEKSAKEYNTKILAQRMLIQDLTGNPEFNPNSPKQIAEAFAALGIDLNSTDKAALKSLDHELARSILDLRSLSKMHGTYLVPLTKEQKDGVIHPWFRQHKTRTGRMASGGVED